MSEKEIEKEIGRFAKSLGCLYYKFSSPAHRGVPDRIIVEPDGGVLWLEIKAPGKKPTKLQERELQKLTECGQHAYWVDDLNHGKRLIAQLRDGTL